MKKLIYVPIIHTSADLGSLAKDVSKRGIAGLGKEFWEEHIKTIEGFWDAISHYFDSMDVSGMKIYQDGMVAEDEVGKKIVEEGVKSGSKNYEIVSSLLQREAILVKTEDFKLVKEERDRLVAIAQAKSTALKLLGFMRYKLSKNTILNKRDRFIAGRINETLLDGETGIVFLGAYHNIIPKLPETIQITEVKEAQKIKNYQRLLLTSRRNKGEFEELAKYLISPVKN